MKISKIRPVKTPTRGTNKSAGLDFYVPSDYAPFTVWPGSSVLIPSGIKVNVPVGSALIGFNKSGIAFKMGLQVGACVVDEDYQGEISIHIFNVGNKPQTILPDMKIVQFVCMPVMYTRVDEVSEDQLYDKPSERGAGGFGSTDLKV